MKRSRRIGLEVFQNGTRIAAISIDRPLRIGRMASAGLRLDHPEVSRLHCILETRPPAVMDVGSRSGTFVNGERIALRQTVEIGDRITIGPFRLDVVRGDAIPEPTDTRSFARAVLDSIETSVEAPRPLPRPPADVFPDALAYLEAMPAAEAAPLAAIPTPGPPEPVEDAEPVRTVELLGTSEQELVEHVGLLTVVGIDKLREHRGLDTEIGRAYTSMLQFLGMVRITRAAPSLLIELAQGIPALEDPRWREVFCASIAHHDTMWPHLEAIADLPGFARGAALAAVAAGRDPLPWLSHSFHDLRVRAAKVIRDPRDRKRALVSVAASFAGSDIESKLAVEPASELALPPVGPLVDGLWSRCADQRAWTIAAVAERGERGDALLLAVADALDAARADAGWPRTAVDWDAWEGVPHDDGEREAWIRAQVGTRTDLPPDVIAFAANGPPAFEPPRLVLSEEALEEIRDNERCELLAALTAVEAIARAKKTS